MIFSAPFKKSIFISLIGHITVFSIFGFSFGDKLPAANYTSVFFWGAILRSSDLTPFFFTKTKPLISKCYVPTARGPATNLITAWDSDWRKKPAVTLAFNENKIDFIPRPAVAAPLPRRKEPTLIFHPLLPYHFTLYFKDRQKVHIELMFNIVSGDKANSVAIKRKISSGNLEADLLSMRYIGHYLFIQQARFMPNNWQSVKIDLSAKE